jgi:hypothetical protein
MKMYRAYILSTIHGTVQIGDTVFQLPTRERFKAHRRELRGRPWYWVKSKDFNGAYDAMHQHLESRSY